MHLNRISLNRESAARWTFGFGLVIIAYRYLTYSLIHQLQQPFLFETNVDYTYWIYHYLGIPDIFVKNKAGAWIFDLLLTIATLWCFGTKAKNRVIVFIGAGLWFLYGLTYNSFVCHHTFAIVGIMVLPFAFLAKEERSFQLVWEMFRYFCLYIYVDAFFHKAFVGQNLFYFPNGVEFIKTNQSIYMLQNPGTASSRIYTFFITHPGISYAGYLGMILLQGSMLIGFFSKKQDKYLFFIPILFHAVNYFFIDVFFFELLVLNLTLLPLKQKLP